MENKKSKLFENMEILANNPTPEDSIAKVFQNDLVSKCMLNADILNFQWSFIE